MAPHSSFRKGTKIFIRMKDGTDLIDTFEDRTGKFVILKSGKKLTLEGVKSIGIYKDRNASLPSRDSESSEADE